MKNKVHLLTSCHNERETILSLLRTLNNQTYKNTTITVVDDGSTDGTAQLIKKHYSKVRVIKGDGSLWWTGSLVKGVNNILTHASKTDFILTINSDCEVKSKFIDTILTSALKTPNTIIGSTIFDIKTNKIDDAAVVINWQTGKFSKKLPKGKKRYLSSEFLSTKGVIYPVSVFQKIGNFNHKQLPHYLSDYEFSCRARQAGFSLLTDTHSRVYNHIERTGIGKQVQDVISFKESFNLLFSRKSRQNIIDHFHFIHNCAPSKYRMKNYAIILIKSIYILFSIYPLGYLTSFIAKKRNTRTQS